MQKLKAALVNVEAARHHLQHMRGDLSSNEAIDYPVLGTLCWSNENASYTVYLSQPTTSSVYSMAYDTQNQCWVCKYQYRVKDISINLDAVLQAMQDAYAWIVSGIKFSPPEFGALRWGKTLAFRALIRVGPQPTVVGPAT